MNAQAQAELRREVHTLIDVIPTDRLTALKPLLDNLAGYDFAIESDLTDEERAIIVEGRREYERNPDSFITLDEYRNSRK